jgi:uncharacterized protein (TIGR03435 family)
MRVFQLLFFLLLVSCGSVAQSTSAGPAFDVVSIKRNTTASDFAANPPLKGGRLRFTNVGLKEMLSVAYPVDILHMYGGPAWIETEHYDIEATTTELSVSDDQYHRMLQAMLADRFRLTLHKESREDPIYVLAPGKKGLTATATPPEACSAIPPGTEPQRGQTPCGRCTSQSRTHLECVGMTTARLAYILSFISGRPVVDQTGYTGRFNINFDFSAGDTVAPSPDAPPSIFDALQEHTGLRLQPERGPVEVLVIDHVEKPSMN